jgi:hypothetical protein
MEFKKKKSSGAQKTPIIYGELAPYLTPKLGGSMYGKSPKCDAGKFL